MLGRWRKPTSAPLHALQDASALLGEASEGTLGVARSPLSGSSKAPFPPDRVFTNDFQWTLRSRDLPEAVRPIVEDNKVCLPSDACCQNG